MNKGFDYIKIDSSIIYISSEKRRVLHQKKKKRGECSFNLSQEIGM